MGAMPVTLQTARQVWSLVSLGLSVPRPPALKTGVVERLPNNPGKQQVPSEGSRAGDTSARLFLPKSQRAAQHVLP